MSGAFFSSEITGFSGFSEAMSRSTRMGVLELAANSPHRALKPIMAMCLRSAQRKEFYVRR